MYGVCAEENGIMNTDVYEIIKKYDLCRGTGRLRR